MDLAVSLGGHTALQHEVAVQACHGVEAHLGADIDDAHI